MPTWNAIEDTIKTGDEAAIRALIAAIKAEGQARIRDINNEGDGWKAFVEQNKLDELNDVDIRRLIRLRELAKALGEDLGMTNIENALHGYWNATDESHFQKMIEAHALWDGVATRYGVRQWDRVVRDADGAHGQLVQILSAETARVRWDNGTDDDAVTLASIRKI